MTQSLPSAQDLAESVMAIVENTPNGHPTDWICHRLGRSSQELGDGFALLKTQGRLLGFAGLWFTPEGLSTGASRLHAALLELHIDDPSRVGIEPAVVAKKAGLAWSGKPLQRLVTHFAAEGLIEAHSAGIRALSFQPVLPQRKRELLNKVIEALKQQPIETPNPREIARALNVPLQAVEDMLELGCQTGEIVRLSESVYYEASQLLELQARLRELKANISAGEAHLTASQVRDFLGTTRKYAVALLAYFFPVDRVS